MAIKHYKMLDCTFPEVKEYLQTNKTIFIPYGLSEQHGAHLPLYPLTQEQLEYQAQAVVEAVREMKAGK